MRKTSVLVEMPVHEAVEIARARQVGAERLFDDDAAPPLGRGATRQLRGADVFDDRAVHRRGNGEVEEHAVGAVDRLEAIGQLPVEPRIVERALDVVHPIGQRARDLVGVRQSDELPETVAELLAEALVAKRRTRDADDRKARGQALAVRQGMERRQQLPAREIARCAEDNERRRTRRRVEPKPIRKRVHVHPIAIIARPDSGTYFDLMDARYAFARGVPSRRSRVSTSSRTAGSFSCSAI